MDSKIDYKTKQKSLILSCVEKTEGRHFTADDIAEELDKSGNHVGKTTVYRHLDKLLSDGFIRKYFVDEKSCACYQYCGEKVCEHFHLKCEKCGVLIHADCSFLDKLREHISEEHGFFIDSSKTVFYGLCEKCRNAENGGASR